MPPVEIEDAVTAQGRIVARCLMAALVLAGSVTAAQASLPMPYAVVGCVANGVFKSRGSADHKLAQATSEGIEGTTIRVEGRLSPGDRFRATAVFVVDKRCRENLHRTYFLCAPCGTLPGRPHKALPRQPGTEVRLSPEAIGEFDGLRRSPRF